MRSPSGTGTTSNTPSTTKKNSKADQFNAIQQQEVKNQQAIQNAGDDILNGLKGSGKSDLNPEEPEDDTDDMSTTEPMETSAPDVTPDTSAPSTVTLPSSNSAAAVNSLLDDSSEAGTTPNSAAAVKLLLEDPPSTAASTAANTADSSASTSVVPQDQGFAAAMQNSQDTPPPAEVLVTVQQETDDANPSTSGIDKLEGLFSTVRTEVSSDVASVKATLSTLDEHADWANAEPRHAHDSTVAVGIGYSGGDGE